MTNIAALRQAADEIGAIQAEFVALSLRNDGEWRRDMVVLRRRLQLAISHGRDVIGRIGGDAAQARGMRDAFERMRNAVALHQADWPAVAIDRGDAGYRQSLTDMRLASRTFFGFVDEFLARSRAPS